MSTFTRRTKYQLRLPRRERRSERGRLTVGPENSWSFVRKSGTFVEKLGRKFQNMRSKRRKPSWARHNASPIFIFSPITIAFFTPSSPSSSHHVYNTSAPHRHLPHLHCHLLLPRSISPFHGRTAFRFHGHNPLNCSHTQDFQAEKNFYAQVDVQFCTITVH